MTVEGSFTDGAGRPLWTAFVGPTPRLSAVAPHRDATMEGGAALVRWTHTASDGDVFQLQSFGDIHSRDDGNDNLESETVFDVDAQYHTEAGSRHDIVVGGGYRKVKTTFDGTFKFSVSPESATERCSTRSGRTTSG